MGSRSSATLYVCVVAFCSGSSIELCFRFGFKFGVAVYECGVDEFDVDRCVFDVSEASSSIADASSSLTVQAFQPVFSPIS